MRFKIGTSSTSFSAASGSLPIACFTSTTRQAKSSLSVHWMNAAFLAKKVLCRLDRVLVLPVLGLQLRVEGRMVDFHDTPLVNLEDLRVIAELLDQKLEAILF